MVLYTDPDTEVPITTHSMVKTMRRCPKQAEYKYFRRLKPKIVGVHLKRGVWVHRLLEVHYKNLAGLEGGCDWREEHARLSRQFGELFEEERDYYGDLPREIAQIMRSYFWHYSGHDWKILDAEFVLECEFPDGSKFRCKIDLLVEDQFGLWIVDHKTHKSLPGLTYRILDAQSADYVWCALRNKLPIQGHIWNYVRWKAPTKPKLVFVGKPGQRLSTRPIETDYLTYGRALKEYQLNLNDYAPTLRMLKARQYRHGEPQTSPFFRRDILEKSPSMLKQVAQEAYRTSKNMHSYPFGTVEVERVIDRTCEYFCDYKEICAIDLWGGNSEPVIRQRFKVGDPLDYYNDNDRNWGEGSGQ